MARANQAKQLVSNMQGYASKLEREGELERAELIMSWAKVFKKIGSLSPKFLGIASLSSLGLSCLYSANILTGRAIDTGNASIANWLGIGFFALGLVLAILFVKNGKQKA